MSTPRLIIFDLDGTLVDSAPGCVEAWKRAIHTFNLTAISDSSIRDMLSEGKRHIAHQLVTGTSLNEADLLAEYLLEYSHLWINHTEPFPGVYNMLEALNSRKIHCAVLTNKRHDIAIDMCQAFFPIDTFHVIQGVEDGILPKPHISGLLHVCDRLNMRVLDTILIGDTKVDYQTSQRAGIPFMLAAWSGLRSNIKDVILQIKDPDQLIMRIDQL